MSNIDNKIRINKYLAKCGLGSRRKVEELISNKKIKINNKTTTDLATEVDIENDIVKFEGRVLKLNRVQYYVMINKPKGIITTVSDPFERATVMNLLPEKYLKAGVFPVGRLDKDTEGLLLLTNDGNLAHKLMHPSFDSVKEYIVMLHKPLEEKDKLKIEKGVHFREFHAKPCKIEYLDEKKKSIKIHLSEGKKRQIRITFKKFQYHVKKLKRTSIGPLKLGKLTSGYYRDLKKAEVSKLKKYANS